MKVSEKMVLDELNIEEVNSLLGDALEIKRCLVLSVFGITCMAAVGNVMTPQNPKVNYESASSEATLSSP